MVPANCMVLNLALASTFLCQYKTLWYMETLAVGVAVCAEEPCQNSWNKQEFIFAAKKGPFLILQIF